MEYGNHLYKFYRDLTITSDDAVAACRLQGGMLVSINSAEEQEFIDFSVLRKRTLSAFIGSRSNEGTLQ